MLIRADHEDHAPTRTDAGVYLASSLSAAVEGEDPSESWFVGTIVQVGPLVTRRLDVKTIVLHWVQELADQGHDLSPVELRALRQRVEDLPMDIPDPLRVGDRVCFSWAAGQGLTYEGARFVILRASEVLAVLEE